MGLFEKLFGNKSIDNRNVSHPRGHVDTTRIDVTQSNFERISKRYYAFDTETTGLNGETDRIIELGAVVFENGEKIDQFGSLINAGVTIPPQATAVNNITNSMVKSAPTEEQVYKEFYTFFEEVLSGECVVCAHNASFDMKFLSNTLERLGYSGNIQYVDTLSLSRKCITGLPNYKQSTVAEYFGFKNQNEHRAVSDAVVCGDIFGALLKTKEKEIEEEKKAFEKKIPLEAEIEICAYIQKKMVEAGANSDWIKFYRNSANYVDVAYLYELFKFKIAKKGTYIIVGRNHVTDEMQLDIEDCTATEGGESVVRVFFSELADLDVLVPYMMSKYNELAPLAKEYICEHQDEVESTYGNWFTIRDEEIDVYLERGKAFRASQQLEKELKEKTEAEKIALKEEKKRLKAEKVQVEKNKEERKATKVTKAILQMDDDMNVIRKYNSLSEAISETGINSKSIRDAAKGVQKHAGGYVWRYVEDESN